MRLKTLCALPTLVLGLSAPWFMDCSQAADALGGCDELNGGAQAVASLNLDAKVGAFVQATADLQAVANSMKTDVKAACVHMATQLGATDTWTALGSSDNSIANSNHTGACDQASAKISAILAANATANATVTISGGQCTVNADVQAQCEATCKSDITCTEPDITVRCDPGQLTGECDAECKGSAVCEGTATVEAKCTGVCDATCSGTCSGACTGTFTGGGCSGTCEGTCDGVATPAGGMAHCAGTCQGKCTPLTGTVTCSGKCDATCQGTCKGNCKLDSTVNVNCGAMVKCKGGCTVAYKAPQCETELKPPMCTGDASCQGSCKSRADLTAKCDPPVATFVFSGNSDDLAKLKAVIETDLPKIWLVAKTQGPLAVKATLNFADTGQAVVTTAATLGGKAIACAGAAASAAISASVSVSVSVQASASVSTSCGAG
jgi:hypothetical protein